MVLAVALIGDVGFARAETPLKEADRIVFLGDSITQAGAGPQGYVTLVRDQIEKQHSDMKIEVIGAGISGNRVPDLEQRLDRDVISKQPTVVVIYIGINDVWHSTRGRGTSKEDYQAGLQRIIDKVQRASGRVILCTPSVIGEKHDGSNDLDQMLDEYSQISRDVAERNKVQLLDLRKRFLAELKRANEQNQPRGVLTTDGVHLNERGNRFVADCVLEALQVNTSSSGRLRHVVLFKFKDDVTQPQIQEVVDAFRQLPDKIDTIADFEWGTDVSTENRSEGFTHCFLVTFRDTAGRDTYLPHAAHQDFIKLVGPRLDKVLVVDYWAKE
jgi:lysophospholipase L1-like esterase